MWIRSDTGNRSKDRLVNLATSSYVDVRQWPMGANSPWCIIAAFLNTDVGNVLSLNDIVIVIRQAKDDGGFSQAAMIDELREIEQQLGAGNRVFIDVLPDTPVSELNVVNPLV